MYNWVSNPKKLQRAIKFVEDKKKLLLAEKKIEEIKKLEGVKAFEEAIKERYIALGGLVLTEEVKKELEIKKANYVRKKKKK
jgi:hypothetical protein